MTIKRVKQKAKYFLLRLMAYSKRFSFPGFDRVPLFYVLRFFFKSMIDGDLINRAGSMAFSFFLALFPAIIFIFSLIPYIPAPDFKANLLAQIQMVMPGTAYFLVQNTIEELVNISRFDLLSFGFIASIFFASNGVNTTIDNFNNSIHVITPRSWLSQRLIALFLVLVLGTLILISMAGILFGQEFIRLMVDWGVTGSLGAFLLNVTNWVITLAFIYFSVSFFFFFAPNKKSRWKFFSAGSSLTTILVILVSLAFGSYVNRFGTYNKIYGSIGAVMVTMLWIYFNCIALLVGYELNVSIRRARHQEEGEEAK
ncbi:YihY/virulence factor BrkB family protein [bacterium SCSIO 12741]|nr:YihY/virulence factor BrkB family protein [bacterium SCSIO 12741]